MKCSASGKGDCWDNAVVESFNATIKTKIKLSQRARRHAQPFTNRLRLDTIESVYLLALKYRNPDDFENDKKQPATSKHLDVWSTRALILQFINIEDADAVGTAAPQFPQLTTIANLEERTTDERMRRVA